jgi:hypothetical protein
VVDHHLGKMVTEWTCCSRQRDVRSSKGGLHTHSMVPVTPFDFSQFILSPSLGAFYPPPPPLFPWDLVHIFITSHYNDSLMRCELLENRSRLMEQCYMQIFVNICLIKEELTHKVILRIK